MPITREAGRPERFQARSVITSSGLVTQMRIASGDAAIARVTTSPTILELTARSSSRVMPGLRGIPAVTTTMSEPAVSA